MAGYLTARRPGNLQAAGLRSSADASATRGQLCVFPPTGKARRYRAPCPG
jgi:hypothetical protein